MKRNNSDVRSLLHLSRNDIMMRFGVPDIDYRSICAYCRQDRMMILVYGLEEHQGRMEETVQGYAFGAEAEDAAACEGIRLFDGGEDAGSLPGSMTFEQLYQQYTVVDIGSGAYRPAMVGSQLSIWRIRLDKEGKILELREEKLSPPPENAEDAEAIFRQIMNKQ